MLRCLISLLLWCACGLVSGAETLPERLSLRDADRLWLAHNRELRLARGAVTAATADVVVAGQAPNPQLSINTLSISPNEGYGAGGPRDKKMDSILRLEQLIERGNKRELRAQVAASRLEAARHDQDDVFRQQRIALVTAYFDLLLAQERAQLTAAAAELYGESLTASTLRLKVGDISRNDLSRLRVEKLRAENDARQAQAALRRAQTDLAYLIGKDADADRLVAADVWPAPEDELPPMLTAADVAGRPDVKAAEARVVAAEEARDLARSLKTRDVTVGVQFEHNLQNAPRNSFGVGVSVPLFVRYDYDGEVARAEADLQQARDQLERVVAQVLGEMGQVRAQLAANLERRRRFEQTLLADAEQVAKGAEFAYVKGAMGVMDLLDARRTLRQVQLDAAEARAEHAKVRLKWKMMISGDNQAL